MCKETVYIYTAIDAHKAKSLAVYEPGLLLLVEASMNLDVININQTIWHHLQRI
jgi:hypothetical protein